MSEHLSIKGKVNYWHLPYDEEGAFSYCHHCKRTCDNAEISLHNGIVNDWIQLSCGHCKKTIWVSQLCADKDHCSEKCREMIKDNEKCIICECPTNTYDMDCYTIGDDGEILGFCHDCYYEDYFRLDLIKDTVQELRLCMKEQRIKLNIKELRRIVRAICKLY